MPIFRRQDEAPRERTPEERERARLERMARRASRSGDPPPDVPAVRPEPLPTPEPDPPPPAPEEPVAAEPPAPTGRSADLLQPTVPFDPLSHDTSDEPAVSDERRRREPDEPVVAEESHGWEPEVAEEPHGWEPEVAEEPHAWEPEEPAVPEPGQPAGADERGRWETAAAEERGGWEPEEAGATRVRRIPSGSAAEPAEPDDAGEERPPIVPPAARRARGERPAPVVSDPDERPVAPKRISARERRLPPTPPPPGTPAFAKRRRRRGRILAGVLLLFVGLLLLGANSLFQPFKGDGGETVTVRIPPNATVADAADLLAENGIVDSSFLFVVRARLAGTELKAGTYRLKRDSSYGAALDALEEDPAAPKTIQVVIPEGRSRQETAPLVKQAGIDGSYIKASARRKGFRPARYGAPRTANGLEGFLFPATYELRPGDDASVLVGKQLDAFREQIAEVDMRRARQRNLDVYDVLIIASMVEREAGIAKERPLIAAVIHNRLRVGMPLQIDATTRYAVRNWDSPLKESELASDSPYNTRRRTGLPPGPIGSPGLDSIRAAADPADVDYLYYVVKPCGKGAHSFSSTDAGFARDKAAYDRKREELGGRSPTDC